jgi:branched-chain amino acid transport system ATP-binding protein
LERRKGNLYLEVKDLSVYYDTAVVLNSVTLHVDRGEFVAMVGPNGAGKSTCLKAMAGLIQWEIDTLKGTRLGKITLKGSVRFKGEELIGLPAHEIAKRGFILCPERGKPFREMTVMENLKAGSVLNRKKFKENIEKCFELFPILGSRREQVSGTLSGGEITMLAIARSLMANLEFLMIDEPSVGLAPKIKSDLFERIKSVNEMGITILLVEQDVSFAFDLSARNYVISRGKMVAEGSSEELMSDELMRKTYLGL